jgi:hypothetical protein
MRAWQPSLPVSVIVGSSLLALFGVFQKGSFAQHCRGEEECVWSSRGEYWRKRFARVNLTIGSLRRFEGQSIWDLCNKQP